MTLDKEVISYIMDQLEIYLPKAMGFSWRYEHDTLFIFQNGWHYYCIAVPVNGQGYRMKLWQNFDTFFEKHIGSSNYEKAVLKMLKILREHAFNTIDFRNLEVPNYENEG